jgi:hypothetical protein
MRLHANCNGRSNVTACSEPTMSILPLRMTAVPDARTPANEKSPSLPSALTPKRAAPRHYAKSSIPSGRRGDFRSRGKRRTRSPGRQAGRDDQTHGPRRFITDLRGHEACADERAREPLHRLSLIDWGHPYDDPLRIQFFRWPRTCCWTTQLALDSLVDGGRAGSGLTHRYADKALFLPSARARSVALRSYAIGLA